MQCVSSQNQRIHIAAVREFGENIGDDVFQTIDPLAQRRNFYGKYVESVIEVFPELLSGDQFLQIFVGGSDNSDIRLYLLRPADPEKVLVLNGF